LLYHLPYYYQKGLFNLAASPEAAMPGSLLFHDLGGGANLEYEVTQLISPTTHFRYSPLNNHLG
jgi:hypothetical protein